MKMDVRYENGHRYDMNNEQLSGQELSGCLAGKKDLTWKTNYCSTH
jgi:hypothetical protein